MKLSNADNGHYLQIGSYLIYSRLCHSPYVLEADSGDEELTQWFSLGKVKHFDSERRAIVNAYMLIIWRWVLIWGSTEGVSVL